MQARNAAKVLPEPVGAETSTCSPAAIVGHENCRDELIKTGLRGDYGVWNPVDWGEYRRKLEGASKRSDLAFSPAGRSDG